MAASPAKRRVLLIDDEPAVLDSLAMLLELEDFEVERALDGQETLERLDKLQQRGALPNVIISDYMMPRLDGWQFCRRVRAIPSLRGVPLVLMSAALPPQLNPAEVADGFLQKPARVERVLQMMESLLSQAGNVPGDR